MPTVGPWSRMPITDVLEELQKLSKPDCLTPKEKADVLIQAHKIVVGQ